MRSVDEGRCVCLQFTHSSGFGDRLGHTETLTVMETEVCMLFNVSIAYFAMKQ